MNTIFNFDINKYNLREKVSLLHNIFINNAYHLLLISFFPYIKASQINVTL